MTATTRHRFTAADVERTGRSADDDGDLYRVQLPDGIGTVFVSDRTAETLGDRLDAAFLTRRLNKFVALVGAGEALGCLEGHRRDAPVELAPDGTVDAA